MQTSEPVKKPSKITIVNAVLIVAFALLNLGLSYKSLNAPMDTSEFAGIRNFTLSVAAMLIILLSLVSIVSGLFMLKLKRWSLFLSFICIALIIPILAISDLKELVSEFSPGAPVSWNHEILPGVMLVLLLFSWRDFRNKA